jgi:glycosyltransferase involved in cell wall biosynthesis
MTDNAFSGRRLRVVHLNVSLHMGGAEKLMAEFARYADRQRFDLRFVSLGGRGKLADEIEACGWPVIALEEPEGLRKWLVFRLTRLFRQWGTDVVHTHNSKALFYGGPASRLARVPAVVHTRHGQRFQCTRSDNAIFRFLTRTVDRVVCVSRDSARLSAAEGITPRRIRNIWNGIDATRFGYTGPEAGGPAVMVGRLTFEKDVETLIQAAALAVRHYPAFRLDIAGNGDRLSVLREMAVRLGLAERVRFLGEIHHVPELLARCSLLVLPSLTEGISLTLLEAMARGLPVVATRVGGNPEVIVDGDTGYLTPVGQPEPLAERMVHLLRRPELSRDMGRRARERVLAHFQAPDMVARYELLYNETLRCRGMRLAAR